MLGKGRVPEHALLLEKIIAGLILLAEAQNEVTKPFSSRLPQDLLITRNAFKKGDYQSCSFNLSAIFPR